MKNNNKARIIAFYLPQFHPFKENDEWWGKGFTEWTNVGKAKPLFKGHYQPKVPTELGYYDLRLPIVREQQAQMAKEAGIYGFCYWHYWFGNGKRLIADIFDSVLESGKPNFPFCLGWANHSWYAKNWNANGTTSSNKLLIEQTYPGIEDAKMHFEFLIKAFKDHRYILVDGRPLLYIFDPIHIPDLYIKKFKEWSINSGFPEGIYIVANISDTAKTKEKDLLKRGFDAVNYQRITNVYDDRISNKILRKINFEYQKLVNRIKGFPPNTSDYSKTYHSLIRKDTDSKEYVIPSIIPNWDHTPRSGNNGSLFINATPSTFKKHVIEALNVISQKPTEHQLIFLKSWNEWGEGNYMEPDIKYGRGYLEALNEAISDLSK